MKIHGFLAGGWSHLLTVIVNVTYPGDNKVEMCGQAVGYRGLDLRGKT